MIRIAVTGPESCGKSTLSKALAEHFNADLIEEFGRTYLEQTDGKYSQHDLDTITAGHLKNIQLSQNSTQIIDTDFVVMQIWSESKYGNVSESIMQQVNANHFDLHILCTPDIPWEQDVLRESQYDREALFESYKSALTRSGKNFIIVKGSHTERLEKSVNSINTVLI
ncbi:MAG: ATP-binding protein [Crocinitomicaceae bacterium]|nr:ATP-binding protein [Crocinitomicaceae bacterium]